MIGTLAAITIPSFNNIFENSSESTAQNQAQRIASVYAAGIATGAPNFKSANSVSAAMNAVGAGSFGAGINAGAFFQLPGITATMDDSKPVTQQAKHYLTYADGLLRYVPAGSNQPEPTPQSNAPDWEYTGESFPDKLTAFAVMAELVSAYPNYQFEIRSASMDPGGWFNSNIAYYQIWKRANGIIL